MRLTIQNTMTAPNGRQIDAVPHKGTLCEIHVWRLGDNHEECKQPDRYQVMHEGRHSEMYENIETSTDASTNGSKEGRSGKLAYISPEQSPQNSC